MKVSGLIGTAIDACQDVSAISPWSPKHPTREAIVLLEAFGFTIELSPRPAREQRGPVCSDDRARRVAAIRSRVGMLIAPAELTGHAWKRQPSPTLENVGRLNSGWLDIQLEDV